MSVDFSSKRGYSKAINSINFRLLQRRNSHRVLPSLPSKNLNEQPLTGIQLQTYINELMRKCDIKIQQKQEQKQTLLASRRQSQKMIANFNSPMLALSEDDHQERIPDEILRVLDQKMQLYKPRCCSISKYASQTYNIKQPENPEVIKVARKAFDTQMKKYRIKIMSTKDLHSRAYNYIKTRR